MKIINPIYDSAFKYLMENEQIAKIVLSIILDTKVVSLQSKPQESTRILGNINISRFDFKAVIQNESGENRSVLVEVQKYKTPDPIIRFRRYLAKNYLKEETIIDAKGKEKTLPLPIISIYILGFDLPEYSCRAIRVDNKPFDIVRQKELQQKNTFIELLTHQSFILIAAPKENVEKKNTRLERFLDLFIQKLQGEESNTIIEVEDGLSEDIELQEIVNHLKNAVLDEEIVERIDAEKRYYKGIEKLENQLDEERQQKEEAKAREEEAKAREEEAKQKQKEAEQKLRKIINKLYKTGIDIADISAMTGESVEIIRLMMNNES